MCDSQKGAEYFTARPKWEWHKVYTDCAQSLLINLSASNWGWWCQNVQDVSQFPENELL